MAAFISKLLSIRKQENNEKTKRNCQENGLCRFVFSAVLNSRSYSVHSRALIRYLQWNDSLFMNHRWLLCDVSQDLWVRFPFHLACQSVSDTAASLLLSDQFRPVSSQSVCSCLGQALLVYIFLFPLTGCTLGNPWQSQRLTGIQEQLQTGRMCESQAVWMESRSTDQSTSPDAFGTHKLRDGRCPNFLKREQIWTSRSQRTFLTSSWHNRFKSSPRIPPSYLLPCSEPSTHVRFNVRPLVPETSRIDFFQIVFVLQLNHYCRSLPTSHLLSQTSTEFLSPPPRTTLKM